MGRSPLALLLALAAILCLVNPAQAASATPLDPLLQGLPLLGEDAEEEAEAAEAEEEVEVCEETEDGEEICTEETVASGAEASDACILKSAEATVLVLPAKDTVRLTLRYTTHAPAVVSVRYSLRGRKGALNMGATSARFSRGGVFREAEKLNEREMGKAVAATEFDVRVRAVNTPGYCRKLFDLELDSRRSAQGRSRWTD
jgi:hypothetical protein